MIDVIAINAGVQVIKVIAEATNAIKNSINDFDNKILVEFDLVKSDDAADDRYKRYIILTIFNNSNITIADLDIKHKCFGKILNTKLLPARSFRTFKIAKCDALADGGFAGLRTLNNKNLSSNDNFILVLDGVAYDLIINFSEIMKLAEQ